jgi:hypothetical protein
VDIPYTVVFEPPTLPELAVWCRRRGVWIAGLLAIVALGAAAIGAGAGRANATTETPSARLAVRSRPSGASVVLDGRGVGRTPLAVQTESGPHHVEFRTADTVDASYAVTIGSEMSSSLDAVLWRRQPVVSRLRPALPGATLTDVRLLADGQVALSIGVSATRQLEAWRLEPRSGALTPLLRGAVGDRVAVAADGHHVAYLGDDVVPTASSGLASRPAPATVVWLTSDTAAATPVAWRPPLAADEALRDASWSPAADRLLVTASHSPSSSTTRSRVWAVDASTLEATELLSLPSEIVPGSTVWSPDGTRAVFVAHAGALNALCLLDLQGGVRYLADLEPGTPRSSLQGTPSWTPDSRRVAYVAPRQGPPGAATSWLRPDVPRAIYTASDVETAPTLIGETDADAVAWREDGQLLAAGRLGADGTLDVRVLGEGSSTRLLELPLRPRPGYGLLWDVEHARLVVANPASGTEVEYWLASLGLESDG